MMDLEGHEDPRGEYLPSSGWTDSPVGFVIDLIEGVYFVVEGFFKLLELLAHFVP